MSEYAKALSQQGTIVNVYKNHLEETGIYLSGETLKQYIIKNENEFIIEGWIFGSENDKFLACKNNVKTRSGSNVSVVIYHNGERATLW